MRKRNCNEVRNFEDQFNNVSDMQIFETNQGKTSWLTSSFPQLKPFGGQSLLKL